MAESYNNTIKYLNEFGKSVVNEQKKRVPKASKDLEKSLRYKVDKKELSISYYMNEYGKFIDKGVSGHGMIPNFKGKKKPVIKAQLDKYDNKVHAFGNKMPPETREFVKWLKIKGIPRGASFVIRRSIWMFGIAPTNFFTIPITRRQKQFEKGLENALAKDIDTQLQNEIDK